jgi:hypothetical protein
MPFPTNLEVLYGATAFLVITGYLEVKRRRYVDTGFPSG